MFYRFSVLEFDDSTCQQEGGHVVNIRLKSDCDSYVIGSDLWDDLLTWAEENGWQPELSQISYRLNTGLQVTEDDANNLADALEVIAGGIATQQAESSDEFLIELLDGLMQLTAFFQNGAFRIC